MPGENVHTDGLVIGGVSEGNAVLLPPEKFAAATYEDARAIVLPTLLNVISARTITRPPRLGICIAT